MKNFEYVKINTTIHKENTSNKVEVKLQSVRQYLQYIYQQMINIKNTYQEHLDMCTWKVHIINMYMECTHVNKILNIYLIMFDI